MKCCAAGALAGLALHVGTAFGFDAPDSATTRTTAPLHSTAIVSIVIDDVGDGRAAGLRAIELPGSVTYAILPHTAHGATLARLAHSLDKEVIVHMPMESMAGKPLGRGGLTANLSRQQFEQRTFAALISVPHAQGISNHMGSRLTTMHRPMRWLMNILVAKENWLFLDNRTTAKSVAEATARELGVRTTFRDVFLDNEVNVEAIRARLRELLDKARTHGSAVAIGHPYPQTLQVLAEELPRLVPSASKHEANETFGRATNDRPRSVRLVSLSRLISMRSHRAAGTMPQRRHLNVLGAVPRTQQPSPHAPH